MALMLVAFACGCGGGGGVGGGGGGGNPPPAGDTTAPTVSAPLTNPALLTPLGGNVTIQVNAADNVAVSSVKAVITGFDPATQQRGTETVNLSNAAGTTTWSIQFVVPTILAIPPAAADADGNATYTVVITATDSSGNKSTVANTSFKVEGPPIAPQP